MHFHEGARGRSAAAADRLPQRLQGPHQRHDLLGEPRELLDLVGDGPDEHTLNAGILEGGQLLRERFGGTDGQPLPEDLLGTVDRR